MTGTTLRVRCPKRSNGGPHLSMDFGPMPSSTSARVQGATRCACGAEMTAAEFAATPEPAAPYRDESASLRARVLELEGEVAALRPPPQAVVKRWRWSLLIPMRGWQALVCNLLMVAILVSHGTSWFVLVVAFSIHTVMSMGLHRVPR